MSFVKYNNNEEAQPVVIASWEEDAAKDVKEAAPKQEEKDSDD